MKNVGPWHHYLGVTATNDDNGNFGLEWLLLRSAEVRIYWRSSFVYRRWLTCHRNSSDVRLLECSARRRTLSKERTEGVIAPRGEEETCRGGRRRRRRRRKLATMTESLDDTTKRLWAVISFQAWGLGAPRNLFETRSPWLLNKEKDTGAILFSRLVNI